MRHSTCSVLALATLSIAPNVAQSAPAKAAPPTLSEIVVTDYVGNSYAKWAWPEYVSRIVLRRDGSAIYIGNPTYARLKGRYQGRITPEQFERVARLVPEARKAGLSYDKPGSRRAGQTRTVLRFTNAQRTQQTTIYADVESPVLRQMQGILSGLEWKIRWKSDARVDRHSTGMSGVRGYAMRGLFHSGVRGVPNARSLADGIVVLRDSSGREVARGRTDLGGKFCISAAPGVYFASLLAPRSSGRRARQKAQKIVVSDYGFSEVDFETVPLQPNRLRYSGQGET